MSTILLSLQIKIRPLNLRPNTVFFFHKLKIRLITTPTIKELGIIQRKEMVTPKNSWEKLINIAVIPLKSVPIKVAVGFALGTNMAIKKGTNNGATNKLIVL